MWASGQTRRRRAGVLAQMLDTAARNGSFREPWRFAPAVWDHYRDESEILSELHRQWRTALAGEVYLAIESGEGDLRHDVASAFHRAVERNHALRQVLVRNAGHPAIARVMRKEGALLAAAAGDLMAEAA